MFKPAIVTISDVRQAQPDQPQDVVNSVFKVLHGFYGNLFLSKFANGLTNAAGEDTGVISARGIWSHGLRTFTLDTVKTALARTMAAHPEYPPTLPQFVALCKACAPREAYRATVPAIGMGQPLRSQYAAKAREIVAKHAAKAAQAAEAAQPPPNGLDALKQAIADAVGAAGGNEAAELHRLDVMFAGGAA